MNYIYGKFGERAEKNQIDRNEIPKKEKKKKNSIIILLLIKFI